MCGFILRMSTLQGLTKKNSINIQKLKSERPLSQKRLMFVLYPERWETLHSDGQKNEREEMNPVFTLQGTTHTGRLSYTSMRD